MRRSRERSLPHSLSCTVLDWERIRDLAERAGKPASRYIVDRVLREEGSDGAGTEPGGGMVLDEGEQRAMHNAALRAEELVSRFAGVSGKSDKSGGDAPGLGEAVRTLFEARLDEMARSGNHEVMKRLLERTVGPERAADIVGQVMERIGRGR